MGERDVWYGLEPEVPQIPRGAFTLLYTLAAREEELERPLLHCAWRVPGRIADIYGGRVSGATEIVAIDRSGAVLHRRAENDHLPPLPTKPGRPGPSRKLPRPLAGNWSADLVTHVGLPPGVYSIFLWLDDMTSDVTDLEVRAAIDSGAGDAIDFARPRAAPAETRVSDIELKTEKLLIEGTVYQTGVRRADSPLTTLTLCHATRSMGWRTEVVPRALQESEEWRFRVPLEKVLPDDREPGPVSVVAFFDGALSNTLTLQNTTA